MRSPQSLQRLLCADPLLAGWDARRRRELALTYAIRNELPRQLAARIRVADAQHAILEIVADSGAVAAAVRQRLPAVLAQLARDGHEFTGIRVRVQVRVEREPSFKAPKNQLDRSAVAALAGLTGQLRPGPLKSSLDRLLKRAR